MDDDLEKLRPRELLFLKYRLEGKNQMESAKLAGYKSEGQSLRREAWRINQRLRNPIRALMQLQGLTPTRLMGVLADGLNATKVSRMVVESYNESTQKMERHVETYTDIDYTTRYHYMRYGMQIYGIEGMAKILLAQQTGVLEVDSPTVTPGSHSLLAFDAEDDEPIEDEESELRVDQEGMTEGQARAATAEGLRKMRALGYDIVKRDTGTGSDKTGQPPV